MYLAEKKAKSKPIIYKLNKHIQMKFKLCLKSSDSAITVTKADNEDEARVFFMQIKRLSKENFDLIFRVLPCYD